MDTYGVDLMGRRRRRRHGAEFKARVIDECMRPGVSVAQVAKEMEIDQSVLRRWVEQFDSGVWERAPGKELKAA